MPPHQDKTRSPSRAATAVHSEAHQPPGKKVIVKNLHLTAEQQQIFDAHQKLIAFELARLHRQGGSIDFNEGRQAGRIGLILAIKRMPLRPVNLGGYLRKQIRWCIAQQLFRKGRAARKHELSADEVLGVGAEGDNFTRGNQAEDQVALRELSAAPGKERQAALLHDVRQTLAGLKPLEKKLFKLHFENDLGYPEIAQRLGLPYKRVCNHMAAILTKFRTALAIETPKQTSKSNRGGFLGSREAKARGMHLRWHTRRGVINPHCRFCSNPS